MRLENVLAQRDNKTVYRDGDVKIKVFDKSVSKADVLNEALNQAKIEETGLNVPKIISIEEIDGKWAISSEYIEGKTLAQLMEENPDKTEEYVEMMVKLHIEIQSKPCKILNRLNDKLTEKIMESELDAITRFYLHRKITEMPIRSKICHGDFVPANITLADDGRLYVIDWSHTAQGNASADVARTCLKLRLYGQKDVADIYFEKYCDMSGTDKEYAKKWFPIVAAALSASSVPERKEKLLKWIEENDF